MAGKKRSRIIIGLLMLMVGVITVAGYWWGLRTAIHAAIDDMDASSVTTTAIVEGRIDRMRYVSDVVSKSRCAIEVLRQPDNSDMRGYMNSYLERTADTVGAEAVYLIDGSGTVVGSSNYRQDNSFLGKNYAFRSYFKEAMAGHGSHEIAVGVTSGSLGYYFSYPVVIAGKPAGVVVTKIALRPLQDSWREQKLETYMVELVSDTRGVIVMSRPAQDNYQFRTLTPADESGGSSLYERRRYADHTPTPLAVDRVGTTIGQVERVRLPGFGDELFYSRHYPLAVIGGLHVYVASAHYQRILWGITALAFMASLSVAVIAGFILQRAYYRRQLYDAALTDPLTGLYTRLSMQHALPEIFGLHDRQSIRQLAVLMMDIDHFKKINDTFGHLAGDCVLRELGEVLRAGARKGDLAGRYGGEEFVIFSPVEDLEDALRLAERLRQSVEGTPFRCKGKTHAVTISIGVVLREPCEGLEQVIGRADACLYQAKQNGRNRICH